LKKVITRLWNKKIIPDYSNFRDQWRNALRNLKFRALLILAMVIITLIGILIHQFFNFIEARKGINITDILLRNLPVYNLALYIFILIYSAVIVAFIYILPFPLLMLRGLWAYCFLLMMRIGTLYLIPLEPDGMIIPLKDPFVEQFFYGEVLVTKDLFFSGHASTLFLLFLLVPPGPLKIYHFSVFMLVSMFLLLQHVHLSIDILAAPIFAFISFKLSSLFTGDWLLQGMHIPAHKKTRH